MSIVASVLPNIGDLPGISHIISGLRTLADGVDGVASSVRNLPGSIIDATVGRFNSWIAETAGGLLDTVMLWLLDSTTPHLGSPWFQDLFLSMVSIGVVIVAAGLLIELIRAALAGSPRTALNAIKRLPAIILAWAATIIVADAFLVVIDYWTRLIVGDTDLGATLTTTMGTGALMNLGPVGAPVAALAAVLVLIATLTLLIMVVVRSALLYVLVAFSPLAFAFSTTESMAGATRRIFEMFLGFALAKVVAVTTIVIGAHLMAGQSGFAGVITGAVVLGIGGFSPMLIMRLLPVGEMAAVGQYSVGRVARFGATTATAPGKAAAIAKGGLR